MKKILFVTLSLIMLSCNNRESSQSSNGQAVSSELDVLPLKPKIVETDASREETMLYNEAYNLWYKNHAQKSIAEFRKFIKLYPNSSLADDAQRMLGTAYSNLENYSKSIEEFEKVKRIYPNSNSVPGSIYDLAHLYFYSTNEFDKAKKYYEEVISIATVDDKKIWQNASEQINNWDENTKRFTGYTERSKKEYAVITTIADGYDVRKVNLWSTTGTDRKIVDYCINNEKVEIDHRSNGYVYVTKSNGISGYCLEGFLK